MNLTVELVKGKSRRKVREIYTASFLKEDRMPFWLMLALAKTKNTDFLTFYDGDTLCGFVYMAAVKDLAFVMFFAVDETLRSKGYGGKILKEVQSIYPDHKIIMSIERCDEPAEDLEQRLRRKRFYLRNGYAETGCFLEMNHKAQEILIKNGTFQTEEFLSFFLKYSNGTVRPKIWKR
ncbi:GNAT family N-acetyltransferase [Clostridium sp. D33t1_170424_F3]|uniref:GNAT family N-acetyltransferase n=1 Tax=Clostridium sp. D33t1_170424_F3 TaxID=2787099 RepID=UPI0018A8FF07|nr:GNAT family N-acetyltransferase [Clostridium sp. D33t1_170424_F3]